MTSLAIRYLTFLRRPGLPRSCVCYVLRSRRGPLFTRIASNSTETSQAAKVDLLGEPQPSNSKPAVEQHGRPIGRDNTLPPLQLPPRVKGYPTPWFDKEDFETYVRPLYLRGWGLTLQHYKRRPSISAITSVLAAEFPLADFDAAMAFLAEIGHLANSEKHHPITLNLLFDKPPTVTVQIFTHTALRPDWIGASPSKLKIPGVTRRDLRMAVLIDQLYAGKYEGHEARLTMGPSNQLDLNTIIQFFTMPWENLEKWCPLCGAKHLVLKCRKSPTRAPKLSHQPYCMRCKERHGPMDRCPRREKLAAPLGPCPNCGGAHLLDDCREAQFPSSEAETMQLPLPKVPVNVGMETKGQ